MANVYLSMLEVTRKMNILPKRQINKKTGIFNSYFSPLPSTFREKRRHNKNQIISTCCEMSLEL
jgi:hypothetical protein